MEIKNIGIVELLKLYAEKKISPKEVTQHYLSEIEAKNPELNAYITVNEKALEQAEKVDFRSDNDLRDNTTQKLIGIPLAVKDVFTTKDTLTTCASHILDGYVPAFESTVTQKCLD